MPFFLLALRNLARRPLRAGLAASGVGLAVASVVTLVGLARGHARAWEHSLQEQGTDVMVSRKGAVELLSTSIEEDVGEQLARLPGVRGVASELLDLISLDSGQSVILSGRPTGSYLWTSLEMTEGKLPPAASTSAVALGQGVAEALGLHSGDAISVEGHRLTITGVVRAAGALPSHMLFVPLPEMQRMLHRVGAVTMFSLRLDPSTSPVRMAAFLQDAARAFPDLTFAPARDVAASNPVLKAAGALAWSVSVVALLMGLVGVLNTLLMSVSERVREIGILSAIGWQPSRVMSLIVIEGLMLAVAGGVVGIAVGLVALRALVASPHVSGLIEPAVTLGLLGEVAIATVAVGGLGSLYPAWRATRLSPVAALKHE
jgi:putative ABC transport system permease protein